MTDQVQEPVSATTISSLNQRQLTMMRFNEHCAIMVKVLNDTPMHPTYKSYAGMNFDQFAFWVREAINQIPDVLPSQEPAPVAPVSPTS